MAQAARSEVASGGKWSLKKMLNKLSPFKKPYMSELSNISQIEGFCYAAEVPESLKSDQDGRSCLVVYEEDIPLPLPRAIHDEIKEIGEGRHSHWGKWIMFSSTDNTCPLENGRTYWVKERVGSRN